MSDADRQSFGEFLRSRRGKLSPEDVGLPAGRRRRTAGLRREEVAERAGIGVDWYIRLEQGRMVRPSASTINALAEALNLSSVERAHLTALAHSAGRRRFEPEEASPTLRHVVQAIDQPAYVTGCRWDVLVWNTAAAKLFGDFGRWPKEERNILLFMLTTGRGRALFGDSWSREARRIVAQFRSAYDLWAGDPAFEELLAKLHSGCSEFTSWWDTHDIAEPSSGHKHLHTPDGDLRAFDYATFQANDDPGLKLAIYAAAAG